MTFDTVAAREFPVKPEAPLARSTGLFRNQFFLGPRCPEQLSEWPGLALANGLWLVTHPQLPVTRVARDKRALTLVGFALDPEDPVADDRSLLSRLLESCDSIEQVARDSSTLGGRWLLVVECEDGDWLLPDALGLRQALYTRSAPADGLWVMSQPGLAAELLGLQLDERAVDFLDSYVVRAQRPEYYWPGTSTPLHGLRRLLPNHVLDLRTGEAKRFWPDAPLPSINLEHGIQRVTALMTGLLCAAAARYELALAMTAGIDSRLMLAAARPIQHHVSYVTVRQARMRDDNADLQVPGRLLARLGLPHDIIRAPGSMSPDFSWQFKRNVFLAHDHYGPDAEAILARFGRQKVAVTGSGAEVARCSWRQHLPLAEKRGVTARQLAWLEGVTHPFAVEHFQEWLDDASQDRYAKRLDLFEWEQGQGSWLAMTQLEFDCAWRDILTPYNCRALLTTMMSVDERFRRAPKYSLFKLSAERMWPEVLSEPVNPHKQTGTIGQVKTYLKRGVRWYFAR